MRDAAPHTSARTPRRDSSATTLFVAVGLSVAATLGVTFSSAATGSLQDLWRTLTADRNAKVTAELDLQAGTIGALDQTLRAVKRQVAALDRRATLADRSASEATVSERFAKLDSDIAALTAKLDTLAAGQARSADDLNAALSRAGIEIGALRSSVSERDDRQDQQIAALSERLDRLQNAVAAREATGSIGHRRRVRRAHRPQPRQQSEAPTLKPEFVMFGLPILQFPEP